MIINVKEYDKIFVLDLRSSDEVEIDLDDTFDVTEVTIIDNDSKFSSMGTRMGLGRVNESQLEEMVYLYS